MSPPRLLRKTVSDLRWQVFWYGSGLALMAAFVVLIFPSYRDQIADFEIPEALQAIIGDVDYSSGPGFVSAEFFSWVPLVLVVFAIMSGMATLAGEEADGTLDLLLAQPVNRTRLVVEKQAGLLIADLAILCVVCIGWLGTVPFVDLELALGDAVLATFNLLPLMLFFQTFSMWVSVALSSRTLASGTTIGVAVVSYFLFYLASLVDAIEVLRYASVFFHAHSPETLLEGVHWSGLTIISTGVVLLALGTSRSFRRHDIGVTAPRLRFTVSLKPFGRQSG